MLLMTIFALTVYVTSSAPLAYLSAYSVYRSRRLGEAPRAICPGGNLMLMG